MRVLYELIGAGVLLGILYLGIGQVVSIVQSLKPKKDETK